MPRFLVTGGAGFIGSNLCRRLLSDGHEVVCVDNLITGNRHNIEALTENTKFEFIEHDITTPFHYAGPLDRILHLASPASPVDFDRLALEILRVNSVGTEAMLKLALEKQASFLLASTSEVYGSAKEHPQPEEYWGNVNPNGPRSCYDESKRFAESFTINFGRRYRVPYAIVRIFNTYGPHMRANDGRVVSNFVVQALAGKELTIYGKGTHTRCFCYVDDLVEGVSRAAELRHPEPINLGSAHEITIRALAEMVLRLTGGTGRLVFQPLPVDDPHVRQPKLERANRLLGWQPTIPLEEGLRRTIAFFRGKKPPL